MARFSEYTEVEVDVDINPDEFISRCKHSEIEELILKKYSPKTYI